MSALLRSHARLNTRFELRTKSVSSPEIEIIFPAPPTLIARLAADSGRRANFRAGWAIASPSPRRGHRTRIAQAENYAFFQKWTSADFPRFLVIEIDHANPYFDDRYAVNSANLGPCGDAINQALIPEIGSRFRGVGSGWARFTYSGSTGGWEALTTQVFYPDMYNDAFASCPDPIDFRAYTLIGLYKDANAYTLRGEPVRVERPALRNYLGRL